jgi:Double-GTPase 1
MSEPAPFQCLMAGLPETGKTTFLAALWHVAKSHEVAGSMRLERREGDQEYLNHIADEWSKCAELKRTPGEGEMSVTVLLRDPENNGIVRLSIPDMSGELFAAHWETRCCTAAFADLVNEVGGCLLFVHPGKLTETLWIADANATLKEWAGEESGDDEEADIATGSAWDPRTAPTQLQMVELLQFMAELSDRQMRLAVIVSAWDLVTEPMTPAKWVENRLPLLWQFITANPALYSASFMGVSAQGGDRSDASLLEHETASRRIRVHAPGSKENDISYPVRWLMSTTALS